MPAFTALRRAAAPGAPSTDTAERAVAAPARGAAGDADYDAFLSTRRQMVRKLIILGIITYFVLGPAVSGILTGVTLARSFLLAGGLFFILVVTTVALAPANPGATTVPWAWLVLIVALGIALFAVGGQSWITILAVTAAACGRFTASIWAAAFGATTCAIAGLVMALQLHYSEGNAVTVLILPPMAAFFAYTAGNRTEMVATLRQTRAELARIAVSEERLRIARDMHDLLGHSLSLITLKAELARRMIATDADRAAREIAELEAVARQSLSDVREAVAGYRQPDLAAELAAARQLLTAAGVACHISGPQTPALPGDVDAVLAWTVREGVTNVVRHAGASSAVITVATDRGVVVAEISDNGSGVPPGLAAGPKAAVPAKADHLAPGTVTAPASAGPDSGAPATPGSVAPGPATPGLATPGLAGQEESVPPGPGPVRLRLTGSGLAGLGERVRELGGNLAVGRTAPRGFCLRVTIPLAGREG